MLDQQPLFRNLLPIGNSASSPASHLSLSADLQQLTTSELIYHCLNVSDGSPWIEFVRRFQPVIASAVLKTLRRCVRPNHSLVDDLVQETYLKLFANDFKALREFDCRHEHALAGFLKVVASNVTQDYLRNLQSQKRGNGTGEDDLEKAMPKIASHATLPREMERTIILGQIERCLERQRSEINFERDCQIFRLYYRQGFTARAIAKLPGIALSTKGVESALFRITDWLRAQMNPAVPA